MPVTILRDDVDAMLKSVQHLISKEVLVGVPDSAGERDPEPGEKTTVSNAVIGFVLETGDPGKNLPARPFLVPGVESVKDKISAQFKKGGQAALDSKFEKLEAAQIATGLIAQAAVQEKIRSNVPPPLNPKTLAARRRRGVQRTNTLVDTGQLLKSITYVIRPKGKS